MKVKGIKASSLADSLADVYREWEDTFGFGPCGAYAALKREQGWGDVAVCTADDGTEYGFTHYVIIQDGWIVDLANPLDAELDYSDVEVLDADEMPELVDAAAIEWLRERGV